MTKQSIATFQKLDRRASLAMTDEVVDYHMLLAMPDEVMGGHASLGVTNNVIANAVKQSSTSKINIA